MLLNEIVSTYEDISRRNFLRGTGAAALGVPAAAKAAAEPDEENVFWGVRKDYNEPPRKLYPSVAVDKPDQYVKQLNVVIYSGTIFNEMRYSDFVKLKQKPDAEVETVPAGKIPGLNEKVVLAQIDEYNYFVTQSRAAKFAQEYSVEQMAKRGRDIKQRMARGDWSGAKMHKEVPAGNTLDPGSIQRPKMPWEINRAAST